MDEALCTWTSSPPVFSQSCYGISDCGFQYVVGDWSECSTDCGNGYRSRPLTCLRDDGVAVDLSQCQQLGLPAPDTQMHCAAVAGCTYTVVPGGWGPCSVECLQYRWVRLGAWGTWTSGPRRDDTWDPGTGIWGTWDLWGGQQDLWDGTRGQNDAIFAPRHDDVCAAGL